MVRRKLISLCAALIFSLSLLIGPACSRVSVPRQPDPDWWIIKRVKSMTLDEKVGQLFFIRFIGTTLDSTLISMIQDKHVGGVVYFQVNGNIPDPVTAARLSNDLQECAIGPSGTGIPLLISLDQEGGRVTRITGGTDFPGNMALGASRSTEKAYIAANIMGREIKAIGAPMNLAPVLDVNNNPANPVIGVRSFGENPNLAAELGVAYIQGLKDAGAVCTGKHFPGHGNTAVDSHTGLPVVSYDFATLDSIHAAPFKAAIASDIEAIMTAHIVVECLDSTRPATLSPQVVDGYLRGTLKFNGVVMTDSMTMIALTQNYTVEEISVMAVKAGVDILALPGDLDRAITAIKGAVQSGEISELRLDQSVCRILKLKAKAGLFDNPYVDEMNAGTLVGCAAHRAEELGVAHAAVTLVQNTANTLPLSLASNQKLLAVTVQSSETTTDAANVFRDILLQKHSNVSSIDIATNPTSTAITDVVNAASTAGVIIVATSRAQINTSQATLVNQLVATGKPVIVVGLREPYELANFPGVRAYITAYSYRACGFQAVADAIFNDITPSGLLPVTIPGLYSYGHGLTY